MSMELAQYVGKKVMLVRNLEHPNDEGHGAEEIEGFIEVVAPDESALVIKPKGSTMNMMILASEIEPDSIQVVVEKPRELKARKMGLVSPTNARQHLLDRHGWTLTEVNNVADDKAMSMHAEINHIGLGHYHVDDSAEQD